MTDKERIEELEQQLADEKRHYRDECRAMDQIEKRLEAAALSSYIEESHDCAIDKGWWDKIHDGIVTERLLLMVTEIAEATEEIRNGHEPTETYYNDDKPSKPEGFGIEIADLLIRTFDLCEYIGVDLEECLRVKMAYNRTRPHRHGGKKI